MGRLGRLLVILAAPGVVAMAAFAVTASPVAAACPHDQTCRSIRLEPDHGPPGSFPVVIVDPQGILSSIGWSQDDAAPCIWWLEPGQTFANLPADIEGTEDADPAFVNGHWQTGVPDKRPGTYDLWANLAETAGGYCYAHIPAGLAALGQFRVTKLPETDTGRPQSPGPAPARFIVVIAAALVGSLLLVLRRARS
jgi:hypothetical protein